MINKRLISLMGNAKKYIAWHVIIQLVNLVLNITAVIFMADIIQKASQGNIVKEDILKVSIAIFVIVILRFRFNILMADMSYHASGRVKQTLREKMYSKLLTLGSRYKEKFSTSEIVQISMEGVDQLETYFGRYLPQFFYSMIAPIVLFCVLSTISVKSAVILLICVPLIPISIIAIVQIAKRILKKYWGSYSDLGEIFLEDVQGLTTLKIYKADEKKNEEMNIEAEKFRVATMNLLFMQLNSTTIMDIIAYGGAALGVIISVLEYMKGNINLAGTFTIIMLSAEFFIPLRLLGSFFHIAMNGISASDKMFEILDMEEDDKRVNNINRANEEITFKDVSFAYNKEKTILKNINMTIKEKSFVSIVGVSGSGKSTIAGLISLKNENYKGSIKIGDIELDTIDKDDLYKKIVVVDHNSYLFEGTVYDNLKMAGNTITENKMNEALKKVELYDFLQTENGLNTVIMEKAANLSGGQRQRLALARAILFNADIYIFDEATSNVDVESEESIMQVIRDIAKEKTVILISHRLYNCIPSDHIYFLKDGIIMEEGTHDKLMNLNGEYAKIYNEQSNLESITKGESLSIAI
ncbi:ABC transporter ATP-binding protein/permease [Brachyspira hyodysenteriae]|uniref:ABC transporter ATP-binding protein/permease n=1 Tax=Brachyspira hyodysenteriae TaxID=159 RepID=UPI00063D8A19|nr:ABC transporter ATP-binding protein/permease [Brachyspira hyodysenteriae]AUJ50527.1 cysteine ABC transporter ATP-binding protein [Brachyspira hyodysenteriae]KLI34604.1 cysteine ABC transporter ATP-binding protein [Brachyspira hyodysenteriae]MBT8719830.1 ABC transporter ATP-binding protein/permease [Brachyspira hyodysenteriae]MBT8730069.1 ABC transporter ATP-binding protein/permease [Brachyspira hyodysenteriae]MBT8732491.1 ABC transporter ATP-binding protein/permease [Brachyspira hyodysenter